MLNDPYLKQWNRIVSAHFPELSMSQVTGLSLWSFGMAMTQSSSLTRVSEWIGMMNEERPNTVRQRLKEWYQEAAAKSGKHRWDWSVESCFAPLLSWVLELLPSDCRELFLAIDCTTLKSRFSVLSIAVVYRGSAIPVAWKILKGHETDAWQPYWEELFERLQGVIPKTWRVVVCADRGLYADWLYQKIVSLHWHPFLRINHRYNKTVQCLPNLKWQSLSSLVDIGQSWSGVVRVFRSNPLDCTLLARWDDGYSDPWLIVSDLPPTEAQVLWYGYRSWIEAGYRDCKSDGWRWQFSRITDPSRAERVWLAMAVATLWMLTLGTQAEAEKMALPKGRNPRPERVSTTASVPRQLSCFLLGLLVLPLLLIRGQPLSLPALIPQLSFSIPLNSS